jgi:hypothetical protein
LRVPGDIDFQSTLRRLDDAQQQLRRLLRGVDPARLTARPPSGNWSVLENVRHLLFVEQAHLGRFLSPPMPLSRYGKPPEGLSHQPRFQAMSVSVTDIDVVLRTWRRAHTQVSQSFMKPSKEMEKALERNLRHLNAHTKVITRLLR